MYGAATLVDYTIATDVDVTASSFVYYFVTARAARRVTDRGPVRAGSDLPGNKGKKAHAGDPKHVLY